MINKEPATREQWLKNRIEELIDELHQITINADNFIENQKKLKHIIEELHYVSKKWLKCYKENE